MNSTEYALKKGAILRSPRRNYIVDSVLGVGGFGITYKVTAKIKIENIEVKNQFAIKEHFLSDTCERDHMTGVVSFSVASRQKVEQSKIDFLAEANRLNTISHPNIVAVNEVFEANDTAYYVMEYIDGKSLRHYIENNGVLSEQQALAVMTPIFNAVNYLHSNRLTHLDIKPDNIMMRLDEESGELVPVLIDFGLSKHYDDQGRPTSTIRIQGCSNGYAPIEQYQGINSFSPTADVYALGATLYFLLVGKDPIISGELSREILERELPATLSDETRGAIIHAMNLIKAERTQSVSSFAHELGISLDAATATSVSSESLTQSIVNPKPKKKDGSTEIIDLNKPKLSPKRWVTPVLIGLVVLVIGVLGYYAVSHIFGGSTTDSSSVAQAEIELEDSTSMPDELAPESVPIVSEVEVVDESVDDGYSVAYSEALNLYNQKKYGECKSRCQSLLRQYSSREQRRQLNQLIEYCDAAIEAETSAELERQYQSDYSNAERLYTQGKYTECKQRCQTMLNSYPTHRTEINALISKCDSAISAAEQAAAASRLPDKAVDLGLSVLWSDRNVGASSPSDYGGYYAWGETSTKSDYSWSTYTHCDVNRDNCHNIGSNIAGTRYDVARQKWGGGWKMPTKAQFEELRSKCTWTWTTEGVHSGYKVTGPNGNSIFLPAAGYRYGTSSDYVGRYGLYWSATLDESSTNYAWSLGFSSGGHDMGSYYRDSGQPVRPVTEK